METVCIKIENNLLDKINKNMKQLGYSTKTEFVREAIRKKIEEDERDVLIKKFLDYAGKAPKKTTSAERRKAREQAILELAKEKGWEI